MTIHNRISEYVVHPDLLRPSELRSFRRPSCISSHSPPHCLFARDTGPDASQNERTLVNFRLLVSSVPATQYRTRSAFSFLLGYRVEPYTLRPEPGWFRPRHRSSRVLLIARGAPGELCMAMAWHRPPKELSAPLSPQPKGQRSLFTCNPKASRLPLPRRSTSAPHRPSLRASSTMWARDPRRLLASLRSIRSWPSVLSPP